MLKAVSHWCFAVGVILFLQCAMINTAHTAKTLDPGEAAIGLSMNGSVISYTPMDDVDSTFALTEDTAVTTGTILPNISFGIGIVNNLEVGANFVLSIFGIDAYLKYRILHLGRHHIALSPTFSYYSFSNFAGGGHLTYTFEANDRFLFNVSFLGNYTYLETPAFLDFLFGEFDYTKDFMTLGFNVAPEIRGRVAFFRPSFEYSAFFPLVENPKMNGINYFRVTLAFGWFLGREKKQLDRIEEKIDRLEKK